MRKVLLVLVAMVTLLLPAFPAVAQSPPYGSRDVALRLVAEGLTAPVTLAQPRDRTGRLFVVDQPGLIRILTSDGTLLPEPFLDLRASLVPLMPGFDERGLLGLAFHPGYARNGRFFVYYSAPLREGAPEGFNHTSHISEFRVSADPDRADPASERILLQVDEPQFNHNAGTLLFGPDGLLYIALGDGGGANDVGLGHVADWYADNEGGNGQDVTQDLLGNILRIDVDSGDPYGIPRGNPFAARPGCADGCDEIFAYGFRNPYRMSFDQGGRRQLFVADVGQGRWEEVSIVTRGGNYGWNVKEGTHCFSTATPDAPPATCPDRVASGVRQGDRLIDPVIEYANANQDGGLGLAIAGGHVYRGKALRTLAGRFVFGDWSRAFGAPDGTLFVAEPRRSGLWAVEELRVTNTGSGRIDHFVLGLGQDSSGEMYVLGSQSPGPSGTTGKVFKLVRPGT